MAKNLRLIDDTKIMIDSSSGCARPTTAEVALGAHRAYRLGVSRRMLTTASSGAGTALLQIERRLESQRPETKCFVDLPPGSNVERGRRNVGVAHTDE
jgi:hypothetical protein